VVDFLCLFGLDLTLVHLKLAERLLDLLNNNPFDTQAERLKMKLRLGLLVFS